MASAILFGKYHLLERFSAGGMAEVYKAKSYGVAGFEKLLVIKKILPNLSSDHEFLEMFLDEARITVNLSHGNIVQVIELGKEGDTYFMAMEFVHGYDLSRVLVRSKQASDEPSLGLILYIVGEVLKALDYAHRRKDREQRDLHIVHCDVSPQNVLLSYEGEVKLADFGISKAAFQSAQSREVVRGKYAYMSPEQVLGKPLDRRSDIFAVGILLWEMLTGKRLFKTDKVDKTLEKVLKDPIPAPSAMVKGLAPELDRIVLKALARDREARYQEDQDMLDDLYAFMFSQDIVPTAGELSTYLKRLFAEELKRAQAEEQQAQEAGRGAEVPDSPRSTLFIPLDQGRKIPSHRIEPENTGSAVLVRTGVTVLVAEWNIKPDVARSHAEQARRIRALSERFQRRVEQSRGELWEVNHNSLVACWRIETDPRQEAGQSLEAAFGLQDELKASGGDAAPIATLDLGLHAGAVIVERRTGHPLLGWQVTRTFAIPRLAVNTLASRGGLVASPEHLAFLGTEVALSPFAFSDKGSRLNEVLQGFCVPTRRPTAAKADTLSFSPFTRYLGRERLLEQLLGVLEHVGSGPMQVVVLEGEEGSGRSRLREELRLTCKTRGVGFFSASAQPETRHFARPTLIDALRRICGMSWLESREVAQRKLARLIELGLSQEELEAVGSLFDEAPGTLARTSDTQRLARLHAVFDKIVAGLSRDAPLVLVIEDYQHVDFLTEAWLQSLVSREPTRRLLVLLEVPPEFPVVLQAGAPLTRIRIEPLVVPMVTEMVSDMLGGMPVSAELVGQIQKLCQGNPLLVKETTGLLVEENAIAVVQGRACLQLKPGSSPLPETPRVLLARRYARASEQLRRVLKAGAILGSSFPSELINLLLPELEGLHESLQEAVSLGILKERESDGGAWYRFRHPVYRELALGDPRGGVGRTLYSLLAQRIPGWPDAGRGNRIEWVATAARAGHTPEAPALLERAGDKLTREGSPGSSLGFYRRALEAAGGDRPGLDALRRRLRWKIASAMLQQSLLTGSDNLLEHGVESAIKAATGPEAAALLLELGQQYLYRGEPRRAIQVLREGWNLARRDESVARVSEIERVLGMALLAVGKVEESLDALRNGYLRARMIEDRELLLAHAQSIGNYFHQLGDYAQALESFKKVLKSATEAGDRSLLLSVLVDMGEVLQSAHRTPMALACLKEALELARQEDDPLSQVVVLNATADVFLAGGEAPRAYPYLRAGLELASQFQRPQVLLNLRLSSIWLKGQMSDPKAALRELQQLMSRPESQALPVLVLKAHLVSGHTLVKARELLRARESFDRVMRGARELWHAPLLRAGMDGLTKVTQGGEGS